MQRIERGKLISVQNTLKQFNIQSSIRGRKIVINNAEYDAQSALQLINKERDYF